MDQLRVLEAKGIRCDDLHTAVERMGLPLLTHYRTQTQVRKCSWCPLYAGCKVKSLGFGSYNSPVMIINEAASAHDVRWGQAMVGPDGWLLSIVLDKLGVDRQMVYVTNLIKCYREGVTPSREEADNCMVHLAYEIQHINPAVIITMGQLTAATLLDDPNFRLMQDRGKWRMYAGTYHVMPTISLEQVLALEGERYIEAKRTIWGDFSAAFERARELRPDFVYRATGRC